MRFRLVRLGLEYMMDNVKYAYIENNIASFNEDKRNHSILFRQISNSIYSLISVDTDLTVHGTLRYMQVLPLVFKPTKSTLKMAP